MPSSCASHHPTGGIRLSASAGSVRGVSGVAELGPRPIKKLAVVTCMDCRIDVFAVLRLEIGDAHVIRNAGGRVTDDVLRSLALSTHVLGTDSVILMQHTECGLSGASNED